MAFTDQDLLAQAALGVSVAEAARSLGVTRQGIFSRCYQRGWTWRYLVACKGVVAEVAAPAPEPASLDLAATGGRYRDLRAYAEAHGLTFTQALQRWHVLRARGEA